MTSQKKVIHENETDFSVDAIGIERPGGAQLEGGSGPGGCQQALRIGVTSIHYITLMCLLRRDPSRTPLVLETRFLLGRALLHLGLLLCLRQP
jgi:hypothetical protein